MNYDTKHFLKKFEAIPEDRWITGTYGRNGQYCALGHCMNKRYMLDTEESAELRKVFQKNDMYVQRVNDGYLHSKESHYIELGDSPKERVINALTLIDSGILEDL